MRVFLYSVSRAMTMALSLLMVGLLAPTAQAYDFERCRQCHEADLAEAMSRRYLHRPFAQRECAECHAPKKNTAVGQQESPAASKNRRNVFWLGESHLADTRHGFLLPGQRVGDVLVVEALENEGGFTSREVPVPPLEDLTRVGDTGSPPVISDVRLLSVRRGVFLSARIAWRTDVLADAAVHYGKSGLTQISSSGARYGRRHEAVLNDLEPDTDYRFSVVSTDLFGREQVSEPSSFSTSRPLDGAPSEPEGPAPTGEDGAGLTTSFRRLGSDYLLEIEANEPVSVHIGSTKKPSGPGDASAASGGDEIDAVHEGLSSQRVASMEACRGCHRKQTTVTHPVNVYPKPEMDIPPEYPTLPDGRITCRSCHESHASEHEYLTIKRGKRELCIGCHKDMI